MKAKLQLIGLFLGVSILVLTGNYLYKIHCDFNFEEITKKSGPHDPDYETLNCSGNSKLSKLPRAECEPCALVAH